MAQTLTSVIPVLYAATRQGVVALAGDSGDLNPLPGGLNGQHVTALAADARGMLRAAATTAGLRLSRDGGATWQGAPEIGSEPIVALAARGATLYAATARPALWRIDGSALQVLSGFEKVWRERHAAGGDAQVVALLAVGSRLLIASGGGIVILSEDGGGSFRETAGGLPVPLLCLAPGGGEAVLAGTGEGLYRCGRPGSDPWKRQFSDPDRGAVTAVAATAGGARWIVGLARRLQPAKPGSPAGADAALIYGDGKSFHASAIDRQPVLRGRFSAIVAAGGEGGMIFAGTTAGEVFASRDQGTTFSLAAATLPGVLALSAGPARG